MAGQTSSQIKSLRDNQAGEKEGHFLRGQDTEFRGKKGNPSELIKQTVRYEKYSKYWSILSNIAALVSLSSALYSTFKKQRRWL